MRFVQKTMAPASLVEWIAENKGPTLTLHFEMLPGRLKAELKGRLLAEQGHLCAYTGLRIGDAQSHIEHLIPQKTCGSLYKPELVVDYHNVVACYPGAGLPEPGFGARFKDQWPSPECIGDFVKPTDPSCERRFRYSSNGEVHPENTDDRAASQTIERLNLGHPSLVRRRRQAILSLFETRKKAITRSYISQRIKQCDAIGNDGAMEEFCYIKKQYLTRKLARQGR